MSAAIARALLLARPALVALVPAARVASGTLPNGTPLPAIGITVVSGTDRHSLKGAAKVKVTNRIQLTVAAKTYPEKAAVMAEARKACRAFVGTLTGFSGPITCRLDGEGPDFYVDGVAFAVQTQDLLITFDEDAS